MFSVEFDPTLNKDYLILYYICAHGIALRDDNSLPIGTLGMDFLYEIGLKWIDDNNKSTRWDTGDIWKFSWLQQNIIASYQQKGSIVVRTITITKYFSITLLTIRGRCWFTICFTAYTKTRDLLGGIW